MNEEQLARQYPGKFLVLYEDKVIGAFDTWHNAYAEGVTRLGLEKPFRIQEPDHSEAHELAGRITEDNKHELVDWGRPVGRESW